MLGGMNYQLELNAAVALELSGNPHAALGRIDSALQLAADNAELKTYRGILRLLLGDLKGGFEDYESRWKTEQFKNMPKRPRWDGRQIDGQTLLLNCEQG